jgi:hypothetical protein
MNDYQFSMPSGMPEAGAPDAGGYHKLASKARPVRPLRLIRPARRKQLSHILTTVRGMAVLSPRIS